MAKLLCPFCRKSRFGVRNTHQAHVNAHLLRTHAIRVTAATQPYWRERQDAVWKERHDKVTKELQEAHLRHRKRLNKQMEEGLLPVDEAGEEILETLKGVWAELVDVDEDDDDDATGDEGERGNKRRVPGEDDDVLGDGQAAKGVGLERERKRRRDYSGSLRHYQVAEGRVRAWQQRRELMGRMKEASRRERDRRTGAAGEREEAEVMDEDDETGDDQEINEMRKKALDALAHARAGKKKALRGLRAQRGWTRRLTSDDAASRGHDEH